MFGLGLIEPKGDVNNAGMGYAGVALSNNRYLNTMNPASYVGLDSTTFYFNIQGACALNEYSTTTKTQSNFDANINAVSMGFKLKNWWGASIGFVPYSSVGYSIESAKYIIGTNNQYKVIYEGSGGLSQFYFGNGFRLFKGLYMGINMSLIWGSTSMTEVSSFEAIMGETITNQRSYYINNLLFEYGFQYHQRVGNNTLSLGALVNMETPLYAHYNQTIETSGDLNYYQGHCDADDLLIPFSYSAGVAYQTNKWTLAADYRYGNWESLDNISVKYGELKNSQGINAGIEFAPNKNSFKSIFNRMRYRMGVYYSDSYLSLKGIDINEKSITAGVSIPIRRKNALNLSYEYKETGTHANGLIKEKYHIIKIGLSFNENWFGKTKFQ